MDKSRLVKIIIAVLIGIFAIGYSIISNKQEITYENILSNDILIENVSEEEKVEVENFIKVYVTGEVNLPGVIKLKEGDRIEDAIEGAGGITSSANLKNINLAYELQDGEKIYIPNINEKDDENEDEVAESSSSLNNKSNKSKVNINKATVTDLTSIPGIGSSTAEKIVAYREENGKFSSIEDIKKVSGIGSSKYEKIKDYISVK